MLLARPPDLKVSAAAERVFERVNLSLHSDDVMYQGDDAHYLSVGASALNIISAALQMADVEGVDKILDYGCGAGRVTRWLRAAFPNAAISATDLRKTDLEFCAKHFDVTTWHTNMDISDLEAPDRYDLIWVGSVLTHLSATNALALLKNLINWSRQGGLVLVSLHGRTAIAKHDRNRKTYLHGAGWQTIVEDYQKIGYGYADYENQVGYGISVASPDWIAKHVMLMSNVRLVLFSEGVWDKHHDMLVLQAIQDE